MKTIQDCIQGLVAADPDLALEYEAVAALEPAMIDLLSASLGWPSLAEVAAGADAEAAINAGPTRFLRPTPSLRGSGAAALWLRAGLMGLIDRAPLGWHVSDAGVAVVIVWLGCAVAARDQEPLLAAQRVDHE